MSGIGPRTLKGALVSIGLGLPKIIPFQFNPDTLTRNLTPQYVNGDQENRLYQIHFAGAPKQTLSIDVFLDATDGLAAGDTVSENFGVFPQLAQLELLLYPSLLDVAQEAALAVAGTIEIIPPSSPRVLFIWGRKRVLPVRLGSYAIKEEFFDTNLNTLRASINLSMEVLTYSDLDPTSLDYPLFVAYQLAMQSMADAYTATGDPSQVIGVKIPSL
jgi:hypothetical protein